MGHMIGTRAGRCAAGTAADEAAPVMLLALDGIHQILSQFPSEFEYGERELIAIAETVIGGLSASFLMDSEQERCESKLLVDDGYKAFCTSLDCTPYEDSTPSGSANHSLLRPNCSSRALLLWRSYFLRTDSSAWTEGGRDIPSTPGDGLRLRTPLRVLQAESNNLSASAASPGFTDVMSTFRCV